MVSVIIMANAKKIQYTQYNAHPNELFYNEVSVITKTGCVQIGKNWIHK